LAGEYMLTTHPIVQLSTFRDRFFRNRVRVELLPGGRSFGSVYLIPVFLAFVRDAMHCKSVSTMAGLPAVSLAIAPIAVAPRSVA